MVTPSFFKTMKKRRNGNWEDITVLKKTVLGNLYPQAKSLVGIQVYHKISIYFSKWELKSMHNEDVVRHVDGPRGNLT